MCGMRSWKHTSVTLDDDHILIFGGLADKNKRFDDVWIFEVSTGTWRNVKHVGTPPCPRAHHTATMVGTKMYVWGGYGGHKQRRAFYNDLYVLETAPYVMPEETDDGTAPSSEYEEGDLVWTKINAGGPMPEPRRSLLPCSSVTLTLCRSLLPCTRVSTLRTPYAYHCAHHSNHTCSLIAVPASSDNKMLCVMGGRDHLKFFDDVHFLDLNTKEWTNAEMV
jgi:dynein heavy chain